MAFKLDKQEIGRREELVSSLREAAGKIEDAISVYNEAVKIAAITLDAATSEYNEVVEAARGFAEDIASQADGEFDDKSERWKDGDKGQSVREWIDAWETADIEQLEIDYPEELSTDITDVAGVLEALPVEADQS